MTALIDGMASFQFSLDGPLADSLRREGGGLQQVWSCLAGGIEEVAVLPLADAVTGMPDAEYGMTWWWCPASTAACGAAPTYRR